MRPKDPMDPMLALQWCHPKPSTGFSQGTPSNHVMRTSKASCASNRRPAAPGGSTSTPQPTGASSLKSACYITSNLQHNEKRQAANFRRMGTQRIGKCHMESLFVLLRPFQTAASVDKRYDVAKSASPKQVSKSYISIQEIQGTSHPNLVCFRLHAHRNPQWFLWRLDLGFLMLS